MENIIILIDHENLLVTYNIKTMKHEITMDMMYCYG